MPGRQTVPRAELWVAIQILRRVDGKTNIQIPINAKHVTRGITHRGDLEQGSKGDLWSILFQLIDGRSGVTDFIKVKSHLEDAGPSVIKQNKIAFHHMLANSLADVVAEEVAKRLLPDLNLERKAKWAERVGVGWQNVWLWCKRTFGPHFVKLEISTKLTLCWWKKQHARAPLSARWLTSWPTKAIYWYVTTKVCDAKFAMCTEPTDNSDSGAVTLASQGQAPPLSSPNSETRKDSTSIRQQATRVPFQANLVNAVKRPANMTRKNPIVALHWVIRMSSAHTVIWTISFCLFPSSLKMTLHTLINVVITPSLKLPSRVAKVSTF